MPVRKDPTPSIVWVAAARKRTRQGFTVAEAIVSMGLCVVAFTAFYVTIAQGIRIAKSAREHAAASQLIEQRFEALRALPRWFQVITTSGVGSVASQDIASTLGLGNATERISVGPHPGTATAFTVTRHPDGAVTVSGKSLPLSQTAVRVAMAVDWGTADGTQRTRRVTALLTKGGL